MPAPAYDQELIDAIAEVLAQAALDQLMRDSCELPADPFVGAGTSPTPMSRAANSFI